MARMDVARIFDPLHVKANPVTPAMVDELSVFRFSNNPVRAAAIAKMKTEVKMYNTIAQKIPALSIRQTADKKGEMQDTFDMQLWWVEAMADLPGSYDVLLCVLTHSPNSIPPERCFSILGHSFDDEQGNSRSDYMEVKVKDLVLVQLQFNNRTRK